MDGTPMQFDIVGSRTYTSWGERSISVNTTENEKNHFTVVLACLADGGKLNPMLIFKRKNIPKREVSFKRFGPCHPKGWMDDFGVKLWIERIWCKRLGARNSALLVWDQFRAHLRNDV